MQFSSKTLPSLTACCLALASLPLPGDASPINGRHLVRPGIRASGSVGTIYYHFDLPLKNLDQAGDTLTLTGDNYTDLIMSSYIGGVLLGRNLNELYPGLQFNKDYLYGTLWGQLLQENIDTSLYVAGQPLIDPSSQQQAVMGVGQGGPFQINNYDVDLVYGSYAPQGFALLNYVAIQAGIGFTFAQAPTQWEEPTPPPFNNKYFGPELAAFFHTNDMRSLTQLGTTDYSPAPKFTACLNQLANVQNPPLDVIVNYAYNQGFYGGLVDQSTTACAQNPSAFVKKYDSLDNAKGDSYHQYPYQVRFYLDELYNESTIKPKTDNHLDFETSELETVFVNVIGSLAYLNSAGVYQSIPQSTAQSAFAAALRSAGNPTSLDLSTRSQRSIIFSILENALTNVEGNLGSQFSEVTLVQL
jgi:hypothetical protein